MAKNIKFWRGTLASYNAIVSKDADTLYFINDVPGKVFLGSKLVGADYASEISAVSADITKEISDRKAADSALDTAYKAADSALDSKITALDTAYKAADTVLDGKITALDTAYKAADSEINTKISELQQKDVELEETINSLLVDGGAMVYVGALGSVADFEAFVAEGKVSAGSTFTINFNSSNFYGNTVEIGDMAVYSSDKKGLNPVKGDFVIVQANLSGAVQSGDVLNNDYLVLGSGNKTVKVSTITATVLSTAITKANDAILKNGGNQIINGSLTASEFVGNASSATKLKSGAGISVTGAASAGKVNFDGSSDIALNVTSLDATKLTGKITFDVTNEATTAVLGVVKKANGVTANDAGVTSGKQVFDAVAAAKTEIGDTIGSTNDGADANGSIYARIKANTASISALETRVSATEALLTWQE